LWILIVLARSSSPGAGVDYATTIQAIYDSYCTGCHGASASGSLDLRSPQSYGNTVNVSSVGHPGTFRVRPNSTSLSFAFSVIGTPGSHNGVSALTAERTNYTNWINQGALLNANPPTVTNVSPVSGSITGGSTVTITGTNFGGTGTFVPVITFGGAAATNVVVTAGSFTQITCIAPAHAAGAVNVVVTTTTGGSSGPLANGFTYVGVPTVSAPTSTNITTNSAVLGGNVTSDGAATITARGIVYASTALNSDPQLGGANVTMLPASGTTGVFTVNAGGLSPGTSYSFKAFATNSAGTTYTSPVSSFTTSPLIPVAPSVNSPTASDLTTTGATLGGNVASDGGATVTSRGIVYSVSAINSDPLLGGPGVTTLFASGTIGIFTVPATGLIPGTPYSFRAFAINNAGTGYTTPVSTFTTNAVAATAPTIGGPTSSGVTANSATLGANVTGDGGAQVTARGVVFAATATNSNPQLGQPGVTTLPTTGTVGVFTVNATGLAPATSYSFKAYATNSVGTTYTTPVSSFTTSSAGPTAPVIGEPSVANLTPTSATLGGNVTSDGGSSITTRGVVFSIPSVNSDPLIGGAGVTRIPASGTVGVFTVDALGLPPSTPYVFKAYAINGIGTTYTDISTFDTLDLGVPPNDDFADAQLLPGSEGGIVANNINATKEVGEPDHASRTGGASIWYRWTAPITGTVTFDTLESEFDTVLAVYTGTAVNGLTLVASNDDASGRQSRVSFEASAGVTYFVAIDGFEGAVGNVELHYYRGSVPSRGTYFGLIEASPGGFNHSASGFIKLTVTETSEFTASLVYGGETVPLRGSFGGQVGGRGKIEIPHRGSVNLTLSGELDRVVGSIRDEKIGTISLIQANRNVFDKDANPAAQAGTYTLLTQPTAPFVGQQAIPQGFGHGKVIVKADGTSKAIGKLGDGTGFSASTGISKLGTMPFYAAIYKMAGSVQGVATFQNIAGESDAHGTFNWFKPALDADKYYPDGFATQFTYLMSTFVPPLRGERIIPVSDSTENLLVTLSGAGIASIPPFSVTLDRHNRITGSGRVGFRMKISSKSGAFEGTFVDPSTLSRRKFSGSIFQKQGNGGGYFKGFGQTGKVSIEPSPSITAQTQPALRPSK
jgi:hypothetical protein